MLMHVKLNCQEVLHCTDLRIAGACMLVRLCVDACAWCLQADGDSIALPAYRS